MHLSGVYGLRAEVGCAPEAEPHTFEGGHDADDDCDGCCGAKRD